MLWPHLLVIVLLVALNGFFVLAELAIVSSRPARLHTLLAEGRRGAATAIALNGDTARFLPPVQIGITVISIVLGAYSERAVSPALAGFLRDIGVLGGHAATLASALVVCGVAYVSLVIGELAPKRIALESRERIACAVAPVMDGFARAAAPIALLLRWSTSAVVKLVRPTLHTEPEVTEEEVKSMIAEGTQAGVFEKAEQDIIERVLHVADRSVRAIMVPRPDIVWLDLTKGEAEIFAEIANSGHSRFPVSRGDVDETIGIVHTKKLLDQLHGKRAIDLEAAVTAPLYVHESTRVLDLLEMFKKAPVHMAIVLDEHGSVQGIVTPTDILSGLAGELPEDEADVAPSAVQRQNGSWLLDAHMPVFEVERVLGVSGLGADDADYATLAGFVLAQLGHIPAVGEHFGWRGWRFEVVDLDGRRIDKVLASREAQVANNHHDFG